MKKEQLKPYLFISVFLVVPLLLIPFVRFANNNSYPEVFQENNTSKSITNFGLAIYVNLEKLKLTDKNDSIRVDLQTLANVVENAYKLVEKGDSAAKITMQVLKIMENSFLFSEKKVENYIPDSKPYINASMMCGFCNNFCSINKSSIIKKPIEYVYSKIKEATPTLFEEKSTDTYVNNNKINRLGSYGRLGCVVLDKYGNLATGAFAKQEKEQTEQEIYASNNSCAVYVSYGSSGIEQFNPAFDISARMDYLNETVGKASKAVLNKLNKENRKLDIIAIDKNGNVSTVFNTSGMFSAYKTNKSKLHTSF